MKLGHTLKISAMALIGLAIISCDPADIQQQPDVPDTPKVPEKNDSTETPDIPKEAPFKIKVYDVTSVMATVEVEPLDKEAAYYMDILNESDFRQTEQHGFDDYMKWFLGNLEEQTGKTRGEVVEMISSFGNDGFILTTLKPETKYFAVAVGIDAEGMTTTDVVSLEFSTTEVGKSQNTFEINVTDIKAGTATVSVKTSDMDPYILAIEPYIATKDMGDAELADYIISSNMAWGGLEQMTYSGDAQTGHLGKAGWEYEAIAFGYEAGVTTTDIKRVRFTMAEGGDVNTCDFRFEQTFDSFEMHLSVTPSDNSVVYVTNVISLDDLVALETETGSTEEALKENLELLIEELIADCETRARAVDLICVMEPQEYSLKHEPGMEYIQWAVPVDQDGKPTAAFTCSEVFAAPSEIISTASLTLTECKWYDGTELAALYPETFRGAKGYAVIDMTVEPSEDAVSWWSYAAMEDLTDRSREIIIKNLQSAPTEANMTRQFVVAFWGVNTIMGVAQDADGNYGELLLRVVDLQKDNVTPATELIL